MPLNEIQKAKLLSFAKLMEEQRHDPSFKQNIYKLIDTYQGSASDRDRRGAFWDGLLGKKHKAPSVPMRWVQHPYNPDLDIQVPTAVPLEKVGLWIDKSDPSTHKTARRVPVNVRVGPGYDLEMSIRDYPGDPTKSIMVPVSVPDDSIERWMRTVDPELYIVFNHRDVNGIPMTLHQHPSRPEVCVMVPIAVLEANKNLWIEGTSPRMLITVDTSKVSRWANQEIQRLHNAIRLSGHVEPFSAWDENKSVASAHYWQARAAEIKRLSQKHLSQRAADLDDDLYN